MCKSRSSSEGLLSLSFGDSILRRSQSLSKQLKSLRGGLGSEFQVCAYGRYLNQFT